MRIYNTVILSLLFIVYSVQAQYGQYSTRSLLEKTIFFIQEDNGSIGTAKFWTIHLGKHSCELMKYFPGEDTIPLQAEVNFSLLSSAYIEGKGFSSRGKVDAEAVLTIAAVKDSMENNKVIDIDDIDYIFDNGRKIKPTNGESTDLILKAGNTDCTIKRLLLRKFNYDKTYAELKFEKDIVISAFSFTKEGIRRALAQMKKTK